MLSWGVGCFLGAGVLLCTVIITMDLPGIPSPVVCYNFSNPNYKEKGLFSHPADQSIQTPYEIFTFLHFIDIPSLVVCPHNFNTRVVARISFDKSKISRWVN